MKNPFLFALPFILLSCSDPETKKTAAINVSYNEVLTIPGDTVFTGVSEIEVKENGNILLSETMRGYVSELSPEGEFLNRVGSKGQGPGEYLRPYMIEMIEDSLYLYDSVGFKLNIFDKYGTFIRSIPTKNVLSNDLYRLGDRYINFSFSSFQVKDAATSDRSLYLIFDQELNVMESSALTLSDVMGRHFRPEMVSMMYTDPIHTVRTGEKTFLMTPQLYNGKIFEVTLNDAGELVKTDSLQGLPVEDIYYRSDKFWDMSGFDPDIQDSFFIRFKSLSLGLFQLSDGRIVHFVMKDDEEVREIGVEVFSEDHDFIGYHPYKTDSTLYDEDRMRWSFIKAYDGENTFYTNGTAENGEAEIVVFQLEIRD